MEKSLINRIQSWHITEVKTENNINNTQSSDTVNPEHNRDSHPTVCIAEVSLEGMCMKFGIFVTCVTNSVHKK